MTPLAQKIVQELSLQRKNRSFKDYANVLPHITRAHCFECSAIIDMADVLSKKMLADGQFDYSAIFLPAPLTFVEFILNGVRNGLLLHEETVAGERAIVIRWCKDGHGVFGSSWVASYLYVDRISDHQAEVLSEIRCINSSFEAEWNASAESYCRGQGVAPRIVLALLACINTPRIVGRTVQTPHRRLERDLIEEQAISGSFPLREWTTIHLHITPPDEAKVLPDYEAHLTGRKALHFVRAHLRLRNAKVEFVQAHWRGDASKGIRRSRYEVMHRKAAR